MMAIKIGKITHYYDKIGVAVVKLTNPLKVGDHIKIMGHGGEFTQEVASIQMDHEAIKTAKKGLSIGLKVTQPVKDKDEVFKIK